MFLKFKTPHLTDKEAIVIPASGKTRRRLEVSVENSVVYRMSQLIKGIKIVGDMLYVSSEVEKSEKFDVIAEIREEGTSATLKIEVIKNLSLRDTPASPLEKEGWELFYNEEFECETIDLRKWSPYYLRAWTEDDLAKSDFHFADNQLVITSTSDRGRWCVQDGQHRVSSIQTFERSHLHRFGTVTGSRHIPDFDGFATKYGYFEVRMRFPDTKDGSHFAWWMLGVQDDQHITAKVEDAEQYEFGIFSNQTAEFDIIEQTTDEYIDAPDYSMNVWRPVIHPNGSTDLNYLWVDPVEIKQSPGNEFHVYGFEWDENGTKFYLDGKIIADTKESPKYRMMTLFSLYLGTVDRSSGMGYDRGIYPKEAIIDYFRVYKKKEKPKTTSIVINNYNSPSYLRIPEEGYKSYPMIAHALDQFDKSISEVIYWKLCNDIQGTKDVEIDQLKQQGIEINPSTGEIKVFADAIENQDLFVTAYTKKRIQEVKHIKLSKGDSYAEGLRFEEKRDIIKTGSKIALSAFVYDQYGNQCSSPVFYQLSKDITGRELVALDGVTIDDKGVLSVDKNAKLNSYIIVTAESPNEIYNSLVLKIV